MTSGDTILGLFDNAGNLLVSNNNSGGGGSSLITSFLGAGTYSISVSDFAFFPENGGSCSNSTFDSASYTLEISFA